MIDFCILGSGLSGSRIANLLNRNYSIEVIDKAKGIGGRSSVKKFGKSVTFDHGLQYYSPKDTQFKQFIKKLIKKRILKLWNGNHLDFTFKNRENFHKVIGIKGNNDLNKFLLKKIKKNLNEEIKHIKFKNDHWEVFGATSKFKTKSIIITFPYEQTVELAKKYLKSSFLKLKVKMNPNLTLLLSHKTKKLIPISSIRVDKSLISWMAHENSKKRFSKKESYWTVQTSKNFSKKIIKSYKKRRNYYSNLIAKEFSNFLNLDPRTFKIFKIHGWKYSYNFNKTNHKFYWCKKFRIGVCGDWFIGPNAESSWESANSLFNNIKKNPPSKT